MSPDLPRYRVLGLPFHPIRQSDAVEYLREACRGETMALVVTLGTEMVMAGQSDRRFGAVVETAELVVPDGIGLVLASRLAKLPAPERVAGVELLLELVRELPPGTSYFFYGGAPGVAERAVRELQSRTDSGFECAGIADGYGDPQETLQRIIEARPTVLFTALGFPRQELFLAEHRPALEEAGVRIGMGVGGSLDVYAGVVERAPALFRKLHFEWLYRVLRQPSRWRRMLSLPMFALKVLRSPGRAVERLQ